METAPAEGTGSGGQESPGAGTEEGSGQEPGAGTEEGSGQEPDAGTEEGSGQEPGAGAGEGSGQETPGTGTAGEQETVSGNDPGVGGSGTGDGSSEDAEEETQDTVSGNDIELPVKKADRRVLAQSLSREIMSGAEWTLDDTGKLTILTDAGMTDWVGNYKSTTKDQVTSVVLEEGVTGIPASAFESCTGLTTVSIPGSVTSIGDFAFDDCKALEEIEIPDSVESIGVCAFESCAKLKKVKLPKNLKTISNHMFYCCTSLEEIELPQTVTSIGVSAFYGCSTLEEIELPQTVTSIGQIAFGECQLLMSVTLLGDEPPEIDSDVFKDPTGGACGFVEAGKQGIHVPEGKADIYKAKWSEWADYIVGDVRHIHNGSTFTRWTESDRLPDKEGNYYLTKDVTLHGAWSVPGVSTTLCLNGKTIRQADENENVLCIAGSSLALYDCVGNGKITGGVYGIENNYVCYMYGGEITGNCVGVKNKYLFEMRGGKISGNTIPAESGIQDDAAGVCNEKNFTMLGGEISGNQGRNGGGLDTHHDETDYYYLKIGGNAVITGNTDADGNANNCLLRDSRQITIAGFTGDAQIGITTEAAPTVGSPVNITHSNSVDYSSFFTSDNPDYAIEDSGDGHFVQLAVPHVHEYGDTWETDGTSHWHECACGAKSGEAAHTEDDGTVTVQRQRTRQARKSISAAYVRGNCGGRHWRSCRRPTPMRMGQPGNQMRPATGMSAPAGRRAERPHTPRMTAP